ncbi:MAG: S9 family peptidase [Alphaproteobacteria bacterium]|nr:S9 family peptidase [Alphaproteobacteria bacterium]
MRRKAVLGVALGGVLATLLLAPGVQAQGRPAGETAAAKPFQPLDLFALEQAVDPQISPDGTRIAYVRESEDILTDRARRTIWIVDVASGEQRPLDGADGESSPVWSPDGRRLAYVAPGPEGRGEIHVRWMDRGESAVLADLPERAGALAWTPDGRQIVFTMHVAAPAPSLGAAPPKPEGAKWADPIKVITDVHYRQDDVGYLKPGFTHLFVIPAEGGAVRQLTFGDYNDRGPIAITPDGSAAIFVSQRTANWRLDPQNAALFKVDLTSGALTALPHGAGPDVGPALSPDGKSLAFVHHDDHNRGYENDRLMVMTLASGETRVLSGDVDRAFGRPLWSGDGKFIFAQYTDKGVTKVARFGLDGKMTVVAQGLGGAEPDRPYAGGSYSVARDGSVAFTMGDDTHLTDVGLARVGQEARRLTALNAELYQSRTLAHAEHVVVPSSYDKRPIDAWILRPPGFDASRKYPMILEIHGGPFAAYGPNFGSELQLYAAAGYVVVYANPRGSTSYGDEFANLINDNYPSQDYYDLMSVVDAAIAKGGVDPDNLFVCGGSGGGLLTAWIVGKTHRFKAAVAEKPVIDWTSEVLTVDMYSFMARYWFGKMPWEDPVAYWRRSPISLAGNITTPTMVMVGEEDHRTPPSEAEQLFGALQLRGIPTAMIRVPGAAHESLEERPSQEAEEASAILAWFDRYRTRGEK